MDWQLLNAGGGLDLELLSGRSLRVLGDEDCCEDDGANVAASATPGL